MVFRKKISVEEVEQPEVEEVEVEVPEIEPAPVVKPKVAKPKQVQEERIEVVLELPTRQINQEVIDGVLVHYMTVTEALTEQMNELEE